MNTPDIDPDAAFLPSSQPVLISCRRPGRRYLLTMGAILLAALGSGARAATPTDPNQAKAREIFERVISFETSEGHAQVPVMAEYLAGEFRAAGIPDADIHILPLGE